MPKYFGDDMKFVPWAGMTIEECAELTMKLTNMCRCPVTFRFNGIKCQAHEGLNVNTVIEQYRKKSAKEMTNA